MPALAKFMGHTRCGAVKGEIDGADLGHLTGLLDKIKPAIQTTDYSGLCKGSNDEFVDAVARRSVELTVQDVRKNSPVLKDLEDKKPIKIVGGKVDFFKA